MAQKSKPLEKQFDTPQKLIQDIKIFSEFVKSLLQSLPKQAQRILKQSNLQKTRSFMMSLLESDKAYKFNEFQDYSTLVSKQVKNHIDAEIYQPLLLLHGKIKNFMFQQKKAQNQKKLGFNDEKTQQKDNKKNEKPSEVVTLESCIKDFQELKNQFFKIWKQEYFLMMNYRMAIAAKEIERWTQIASKKTTKDKISKQIEELFI